jgi:hypothetical protein
MRLLVISPMAGVGQTPSFKGSFAATGSMDKSNENVGNRHVDSGRIVDDANAVLGGLTEAEA